MKILVISFFNQWVTHFGTELELAQIHLDRGDQVEFLGCDGCISSCETNTGAEKHRCDACRLRRSQGLQLLSRQPFEHRLGAYLPADVAESEDRAVSLVVDAKSAKAFRYESYDLGWGALSSTIQESRDPDCESAESKELLRRFTRTALRSFRAVRSFLQSRPPFDRVYIFNGRFASTRGAFRACQQHGVADIVMHERGSSILKYDLFQGVMPHSRGLWIQRIESAWEAAQKSADRDQVGRRFFENRRNGTPTDWFSFTQKQQNDLLPTGWSKSKRNIAIFNSSEDEWAGIGDEWLHPIYTKQSEGIMRIVSEALSRLPDIHFYLRVHPNLAGVINRDIELLRNFKSPNLTLVEPDASISTYALIDAAERVLTFGSTVGIEATFWGKISILAGHALYEDLEAVYVARNHEHVMELLSADLEPKPTASAVKYGFYTGSFGVPFKYWQATGFLEGSFCGSELKTNAHNKNERRVLITCLNIGVQGGVSHKIVILLLRAATWVWLELKKLWPAGNR